mmetsp:Transcript_2830/g.8468  ORF Transcript_2830/g.8468 Transcript_2830/m.8468 type:complete len:239 (+) Transcript_2830:87-803(+)
MHSSRGRSWPGSRGLSVLMASAVEPLSNAATSPRRRLSSRRSGPGSVLRARGVAAGGARLATAIVESPTTSGLTASVASRIIRQRLRQGWRGGLGPVASHQMLPVVAKVSRNEGQLTHVSPAHERLRVHRVFEPSADLGVVRLVQLAVGGDRGDGGPEGAAAEGPQPATAVERGHGCNAVDDDVQEQAQHCERLPPAAAKAHEHQSQQGAADGSCHGPSPPHAQEHEGTVHPIKMRIG